MNPAPSFPPPAPPGTPRRKLPIGRWILGAVLLATLWTWTLGPYGVVRQQRTAGEIERIHAGNDSLRLRNKALVESLSLYESDSATISAEARRQGLVLPGEISVRFVDTTR